MQVYKISPTNGASNSYILTQDNKTAVVIDPSQLTIAGFLQEKGLECKYVLLTHGHFDHVGACGLLSAKGARICCNEREKDLIFSKEYLNIFGGVSVPEFKIDKTFEDGEEIELCGIKIKVISTPGHTAGSCCYIAESYLFSGDTLFCGSVGRTDLPTGNFNELLSSLKLLKGRDGDYVVCCGHGDDTRLSYERTYNPYMRKI